HKLDEIGLAADTGLFEKAPEVRFDCGIRDPKVPCDLANTTDIDDGTQNTKLRRRQFVSLTDHLGRRHSLEFCLAFEQRANGGGRSRGLAAFARGQRQYMRDLALAGPPFERQRLPFATHL